MIKLLKVQLEDAKIMLKIQKEAFKKYADKYGDFDTNPYHMSLHRMEFNIKYRFGQYYKIIDCDKNEIIGGIFGILLLVIIVLASMKGCSGPSKNYQSAENKILSNTNLTPSKNYV